MLNYVYYTTTIITIITNISAIIFITLSSIIATFIITIEKYSTIFID